MERISETHSSNNRKNPPLCCIDIEFHFLIWTEDWMDHTWWTESATTKEGTRTLLQLSSILWFFLIDPLSAHIKMLRLASLVFISNLNDYLMDSSNENKRYSPLLTWRFEFILFPFLSLFFTFFIYLNLNYILQYKAVTEGFSDQL